MTPTDIDDIVRKFAQADGELPREAMQRALDRWDEVAPSLLALLEAYADGEDRSERTTEAVFFILHLVGQARDQRAFSAICRLAQDAEALDDALGDGVGPSLPAILIGTYNGDLDRLRSMIESEAVDEFVRAGAFEVLTYLTAAGVLPRDDTAAYLRDLHGSMQPQETSFAWFGWQQAIAALGLAELRPLVEDAFQRELIDPTVMGVEHFLDDLQAGVASNDPVGLLAEKGVAPFKDVITDLSKWHAFSEEYRREKAALGKSGGMEQDWGVAQPVANPLRSVGRNDPCPCGSGKKLKKCCLH